ncbi:MAG: flavin reductase family protein [Aggregatilineales bacterium]
MEIKPEDYSWQSLYKILIGSVLPRPIGWISSVDAEGHNNLAPFSFFNVICANPPHVMFCPSVRGTDMGRKDTLHNVRATGEFVVNIVTEATVEAMNLTATELPSDIDEFEYAGLTPIASKLVKPQRVAESPIHFECKVTQILDISEQAGGGSMVIGEVIYMHIDDAVLYDGEKIDLTVLRPVGRLAGTSYTRVTDLFDLVRRPTQVKPKDT